METRVGALTGKKFGFAGFAIAASAAAGLAFALTAHWWIFAPSLIGAVVVSTHLAASERLEVRDIVKAVNILSVICAVIASAAWYVHSYNADHVKRVLVCGTFKSTGNNWSLRTSDGEKTLDGGFYDDTYYLNGKSGDVEQYARSLPGNWVELTEHGLDGDHNDESPFVTKIMTLGKGSCGPTSG